MQVTRGRQCQTAGPDLIWPAFDAASEVGRDGLRPPSVPVEPNRCERYAMAGVKASATPNVLKDVRGLSKGLTAFAPRQSKYYHYFIYH